MPKGWRGARNMSRGHYCIVDSRGTPEEISREEDQERRDNLAKERGTIHGSVCGRAYMFFRRRLIFLDSIDAVTAVNPGRECCNTHICLRGKEIVTIRGDWREEILAELERVGGRD